MVGGALRSVGIAIVNWNSGVQLGRCLASLEAADWSTLSLSRVVVVDNASTDGSAGCVAATTSLPMVLVANSENRGFAVACNQAAREIDADALLFLNPDTVVEPDTIGAAVACMNGSTHASIGIVGVQLVGDDGHVSRSCARFPTAPQLVARAVGLDHLLQPYYRGYLMTEWDHAESRRVDHVIGAFYLVRADLFRRLGGFDEAFFVYLEDLDFSYRAKHAGAQSYYLATARAYHKGGGSSDRIRSLRLFYALRSRLQYARKHFSAVAAAAVACSTLCIEPCVRVAAAAVGGAPTVIRETIAAYRLLWRSVWRSAWL